MRLSFVWFPDAVVPPRERLRHRPARIAWTAPSHRRSLATHPPLGRCSATPCANRKGRPPLPGRARAASSIAFRPTTTVAARQYLEGLLDGLSRDRHDRVRLQLLLAPWPTCRGPAQQPPRRRADIRRRAPADGSWRKALDRLAAAASNPAALTAITACQRGWCVLTGTPTRLQRKSVRDLEMQLERLPCRPGTPATQPQELAQYESIRRRLGAVQTACSLRSSGVLDEVANGLSFFDRPSARVPGAVRRPEDELARRHPGQAAPEVPSFLPGSGSRRPRAIPFVTAEGARATLGCSRARIRH